MTRVRGVHAALAALTCVACASDSWAAREPVLRQVDVPHSYYWRELYLPQLTTGPSAADFLPGGRELVYSMAGSLWRQAIGSDEAVELTHAANAYDYQPDVAADGREGLALFSPGRYDAVLTDLGMPGTTGLDVIAGVREQDGDVGVIMFTAFSGDLEADGRRLGFTILRKPLDIEGLHRAVRAAVQARGTMAG